MITDYSIVNPTLAKWLDWFWNLSLIVIHRSEVTISVEAKGDLDTLRKERCINKGNHTELPKIILMAWTVPVTIITGTSLSSSLKNLWIEIENVLMNLNY